jgi:DNA-directed RNA polymerase subunit RPC12/RpoP
MTTSKKSPGCTIGAIIGLVVAGLLVLFGVLWIIASTSREGNPAWFGQGLVMIIIGLVAVGVAVFVLIKMRPQEPQQIVQKIDLTGDVNMATLKCKNCGAELSRDSITVKEGAIFVSCPYCNSTYQIVEEPKW